MEELKHLYKRDRLGKIRFWHVTVDENRYDNTAKIVKLAGIYSTDNPVETVEPITVGLNLGRSNGEV